MNTLEKVQAVIADALYVDVAEVTADASLMQDLGAESIDFLDIIFRLEKEFGIKMPKGEIEKRARGTLSDDEFAINGRLTEAALRQVKHSMPEVNSENIRAGLMLRDIPSLFTVQTFVRMVEQQLFGEMSPSQPELVKTSELGLVRV
jgi:acyl carrier protein